MSYMIANTKIFFVGFVLVLLPFLGIPLFWKTTFTVFFGLYLIVSSIHIELPKRTTAKRVRRKEKTSPVFTENSPDSIKPLDDEGN